MKYTEEVKNKMGVRTEWELDVTGCCPNCGESFIDNPNMIYQIDVDCVCGTSFTIQLDEDDPSIVVNVFIHCPYPKQEQN